MYPTEKKIYLHSIYIKENSEKLTMLAIAEDHFLSIIYDILAESYDYLAVLEWNSINTNKPAKRISICERVSEYYKKRIEFLQEERDLQPEASQVDLYQRIQKTENELNETIKEIEKSENFTGADSTPKLASLSIKQEKMLEKQPNKRKLLKVQTCEPNLFKRFKLKIKEPEPVENLFNSLALNK